MSAAGKDATLAKVAVFGSTGAVGHKVVETLARIDSVNAVIAVVRKERRTGHNSEDMGGETEAEVVARLFPGFASERQQDCVRKVHVRPVDYEELCALDSVEWLEGVSAGICTLGTTHAAAGGRQGFKRVDLDYVVASAKLCKAAGARSFSVLTSEGTSPRVPRWLSSYIWTKAQCEKEVRSLQFPKLTIWRPGLIDRQERKRAVEKLAMNIGLKGISTSDLARAMVLETLKLDDASSESQAVTIVEGNRKIIIKLSKGEEEGREES